MDLLVDETYVINMDKEVTRLITFDTMMTSKYLSNQTGMGEIIRWRYVRMPAINGKDLRNEILTSYRTSESDFNLINCKSTLNLQKQLDELMIFKRKYVKDVNWLSPGEVGCLLSHVYLWERVATDPNLHRVVIFEDDARTHMDIITIQGLINDLYDYFRINNIEEPDMLYLGKALDACTRYEQVWNNVYRSYHPLCLHAYLITKQGAQKLLQKAPYDIPIDLVPIHAISSKSLNVMTFHPSLYFQDIINNISSLRELGRALNLTTECLVEQQHISENDLNYLGVIFIALIVTIILYTIYTFSWSKS